MREKNVLFRNLILLLFLVTIYAEYRVLGTLRSVLSSLVTFSNQVRFLICLSIIIKNAQFMYILSIYAQLTNIVFYAVIIPLNKNRAQFDVIIVDTLTHVMIPGLFLLYEHFYNKKRNIKVSFLQVLLYPLLYLPFIWWVSYRRGYMIYPFLNNPFMIIVVGLLLYILYRIKSSLI